MAASFVVGSRELVVADEVFTPGTARRGFTVASSPQPYVVELAPAGSGTGEYLAAQMSAAARPLLVIDRRVAELHPWAAGVESTFPVLELDATEENKSVDGVLRVIDFLTEGRVSRDAMAFVVGGGILQDVAGLACGLFKRGIPWTFVPTTLLAQADSCIGAKTGVNFRQTKNLLGMFAAPRRVLVHPGFVRTLEHRDVLSGLGEIFKLCVTGGEQCLAAFEERAKAAVDGDEDAISQLVAVSLGVKRPVIEVDEFDVAERRALNFGHSIGHAVEAISDYAVPHGIAVSIGVLVECELSRLLGHLDQATIERLVPTVRSLLLLPRVGEVLSAMQPEVVLDVLGRDKKVEGTVLKLAVPVRLGCIEFVDFPLDASSSALLEAAFGVVLTWL